ncbi:MAG: lactate utilization protein [Desulfobacteraceae bacterium]|nr:lactate utilization protein [Desulfobacteraceae bacterium]
MDKSQQEAFIGKIRSALGKSPGDVSAETDLCTSQFTEETKAILNRITYRSDAERQQLLDRFIEMAAPIKLNVVVLKDEESVTAAIVDLIRGKDPEWGDEKSIVMWQHPLIKRLNLADALADQKIPVHVTEFDNTESEGISTDKGRDQLRQQVIDSYIGITSADFCMADTASLVMRTRPGQARSTSLVPSIHIAVIYLDQIIRDLKELYALLSFDPEISKEGLTNCMTFISGPSKTADVEATMVHGAHGPREVYVCVIAN